MYIHVPDPDPGRCKNTRSEMHGHAWVTRRCLDYEGVVHVCTFEPLPPLVGTGWGGSTAFTQPEKPKPWVKPEGSVTV